MDSHGISIWQNTFLDNYLNDRPNIALLLAKPGLGISNVSIRAWERLSTQFDFMNLIVLSCAPALMDHWVDLVKRSKSNTPNFRNANVIDIRKFYNDRNALRETSDLFHSSRTFLIIDEFHKVGKSPTMKTILSNFKKDKFLDSRILCLSGLDEGTYKTIFGNSFWDRREYIYDQGILKKPGFKNEIARFSPSYGILQKLLKNGSHFDNLTSRDFEKLVAQLLEAAGYEIELTKATRDGGIDIIAVKRHDIVGYFKTVWQAKKSSKNKVGLNVIRELADSVNEFKASKGIIVTSTYLTKDALIRVERDKYILGKVDRDDLNGWVNKILY